MTLLWGIVVSTALLIEAINLFLRFNVKLTSQRSHIYVMQFLKIKGMPHIHHVYLGTVAAIISYLLHSYMLSSFFLGVALSDIIHHVLLKILLGNSEFNLVYYNKK